MKQVIVWNGIALAAILFAGCGVLAPKDLQTEHAVIKEIRDVEEMVLYTPSFGTPTQHAGEQAALRVLESSYAQTKPVRAVLMTSSGRELIFPHPNTPPLKGSQYKVGQCYLVTYSVERAGYMILESTACK